MMTDDQRTKPRKGTSSCTECRRRKVRCIRSPQDAKICRRCEERGTVCAEQVLSSRPLQASRVPSRYRISQLESKVTRLSRVIHDIQLKLGETPSLSFEPSLSQEGSTFDTDVSDDDNSSASEVLSTNPSSHLHSLFQNDWLSVDAHSHYKHLQDRMTTASSQWLDLSRRELQKLIPTKQDVSKIATPSNFLPILHVLMPQPFTVRSHQELVQAYDEMHKPNVDPISLASWLLIIAITAEHNPQIVSGPTAKSRIDQRLLNFPRAVANIVEKTILSHDVLVCSVPGLGMALNYFRLLLSQGSFQKAWLRLRHFLSIAELIGLPKSFQVVQFNAANRHVQGEDQLQRAELWESLCAVVGLFGVLSNLPSSIGPYQISSNPLIVDGAVQPRAFLGRLTQISMKIQQLDDVNVAQGSNSETYASVLDLDRQIIVLVSQTPKSWWNLNDKEVKPDHLVQYLHYCIVMRLHLQCGMREDPDEEFIYSRLACRDACVSVAERYLFLRRGLPAGIFLTRTLDLQVFTASVVLLLTSQLSPSTGRPNLGIDKAEIAAMVQNITAIMEEKSRNTSASQFVQHSIKTINSLRDLLQQDDSNSDVQEMKLKIPLLGKVHIRRNNYTAQKNQLTSKLSFPTLSDPTAWNSNQPPHAQGQRFAADNFIPSTPSAQREWQWNPLPWCIEDNYVDFFQDASIGDTLNQVDLIS